MYDKIPFGLINARATLQPVMDIYFVGDMETFIVIYLGDMVVFLKPGHEHLSHLNKTFKKCKRYGITLNPKKYGFSL